jgi:uncharacterized protein YndB with AHSA1/START domain
VTARRTRMLEARPETVWQVVSDPHHYPRWWPGVDRVESVREERFTEVHTTKRGRAMRMDFRIVSVEPPQDGGGASLRLEQDLIGTPRERFLAESLTEILLEPHERGTEVTIAQRDRLRGYSRAGGAPFFRRAMARRLEKALEGLERVLG